MLAVRWSCVWLLAAGCGSVRALADAAPPDAPIQCGDGARAAGEVCFRSLVITQTAAVVDAQLADVDADGDLDLGYVLGDKLAVQLWAGGAFGPVITGPAQSSSFVLVRDLTGDRKADFIAVGPGAATSVVTFRSDGLGGEQTAYVAQTAGSSRGLALANLDGAGPDELIQFDDQKVQSWAVSASAVLTARPAVDAAGLTAGAIGALDGDGLPDLVIGVPGGVQLRRGGGLGFSAPEPVGLTRAVTALAIGDVDGDHKPDLVYAAGDLVGVLRGDGLGGFTAAPTRTIPGGGQLLALADVDGDGRADVIVAGAAAIEIALGQPDGQLVAPTELAVGGKPSAIHAGPDFNGDGAPDLVVTSGMTITIFASQP